MRQREPSTDNETVLTSDAKKLDLPDDSFDAIVSLCALEHFGLGRYGDEFDLAADKKAFDEMRRVLKPGGRMVVTTTISRARPSVAFNANKIYDLAQIRAFSSGLELVEEAFFSHELARMCSHDEVTSKPAVWDIYCGCWTKG